MRILQKPMLMARHQSVEVTFSQPTNVYFMSMHDFKRYKKGLSFKAWGGWKDSSPVTFRAPEQGHYHVVIEKASADITGNAFIVGVKRPAAVPPPAEVEEPVAEIAAHDEEEVEAVHEEVEETVEEEDPAVAEGDDEPEGVAEEEGAPADEEEEHE